MSSLKDIYWMASPLAIEQRNDLNEKKHRLLKPMSRYIDPKNEVHVFRKIEHWTLEIDGHCYELSPDTKKKLTLIKKATDMIKPHSIDAKHWREMRESKQIEPEKRKIGQTTKTHEEIVAEGEYLWKNFNDDWYGFFTQNCQNFAHMLFERVAVQTPDAGKGLWERMPDPIGHRLAEGAQLALATKIAYGTKAAYLGAAAAAKAAPLAEASQGVGAVGTMGATAGGTTTGGTVAAGSTTGGTMAAGSTTGGTMAAGGTTAGGTVAGGSATAAAGSTGTAAAGGTSVGSTTAGGGVISSGHIGVGAKAAGLMHGGHAAAIGSGMAKAGAVAAFAHPVTGIAMTGGLAYLAYRGKKSKRWSKKNKKEEDMDVSDLLMAEDEAFEQAENPDEDVKAELDAELNDPDQVIDEELAEELKLGLVTSEPGTMLDEHKDVPTVQDTKRSQTTA